MTHLCIQPYVLFTDSTQTLQCSVFSPIIKIEMVLPDSVTPYSFQHLTKQETKGNYILCFSSILFRITSLHSLILSNLMMMYL